MEWDKHTSFLSIETSQSIIRVTGVVAKETRLHGTGKTLEFLKYRYQTVLLYREYKINLKKI